jgi:hypothetical protein
MRLDRRLTGSAGAGIGVGGTMLILIICVGVWYLVHRAGKRAAAKKNKELTPMTTISATDPLDRANALELGTSEGNAHQMGTQENTHEMESPMEIHEMGRSNTKKSKRSTEKKRGEGELEGVAELEGDVAWKDGNGEADQVKEDGVGKGFVITS